MINIVFYRIKSIENDITPYAPFKFGKLVHDKCSGNLIYPRLFNAQINSIIIFNLISIGF